MARGNPKLKPETVGHLAQQSFYAVSKGGWFYEPLKMPAAVYGVAQSQT